MKDTFGLFFRYKGPRHREDGWGACNSAGIVVNSSLISQLGIDADQMNFDCAALDNDGFDLLLYDFAIRRDLLNLATFIAQSLPNGVDHNGLDLVRRHAWNATGLTVSLLQERV